MSADKNVHYDLSNLSPAPGSHRSRKRLGRVSAVGLVKLRVKVTKDSGRVKAVGHASVSKVVNTTLSSFCQSAVSITFSELNIPC